MQKFSSYLFAEQKLRDSSASTGSFLYPTRTAFASIYSPYPLPCWGETYSNDDTTRTNLLTVLKFVHRTNCEGVSVVADVPNLSMNLLHFHNRDRSSLPPFHTTRGSPISGIKCKVEDRSFENSISRSEFLSPLVAYSEGPDHEPSPNSQL